MSFRLTNSIFFILNTEMLFLYQIVLIMNIIVGDVEVDNNIFEENENSWEDDHNQENSDVEKTSGSFFHWSNITL